MTASQRVRARFGPFLQSPLAARSIVTEFDRAESDRTDADVTESCNTDPRDAEITRLRHQLSEAEKDLRMLRILLKAKW